MKFFVDCKSADEVKSTYRKLAKCFHPDHGGNNELMIELQKQYDAWTPTLVSAQAYANKMQFEQRAYDNSHGRFNTIRAVDDEIHRLKDDLNHYKMSCDRLSEHIRGLNITKDFYQNECIILNEKIENLQDKVKHYKDRYPKSIWEYLFNEKPS